MGGTTFEKGIGLSAHVFNPKRGLHGLVRETLSPAGRGCASNPKAGLGNLGEEHVFLFIATRLRELGGACGWSSFFRHPGATHAFIEPLALRHIDRMGRQGIRAQ